MVLIVHRQFLAGEHRRDVEREAHIVVLEQQAGADPAVRTDVAVGFADIAEIADEHGSSPVCGALIRRRRRNRRPPPRRSEEHTSELQSLMRISYAVFCLQKQKLLIHTYM